VLRNIATRYRVRSGVPRLRLGAVHEDVQVGERGGVLPGLARYHPNRWLKIEPPYEMTLNVFLTGKNESPRRGAFAGFAPLP
jgi:hypothetical protein